LTSSSSLGNANRATFKHHVEAIALRVVIAVFAVLPIDAASWAMGKLWRYAIPFQRRNARAMANLAYTMPSLSKAERRAIVDEARENFGRVFIEAFRLKDILADETRIDLSDASLLDAMTAADTGFVIASLHQGNWEANTCALLRKGIEAAGVYRQLSNPIVEVLVETNRAPFYPLGLLCKRPGSDLARKLLTILKAGGAIAILADLRDATGIKIDFLDRPSLANPSPAFLARITGKPLLVGRLVRTRGARFRAEVERIDVPVTEDRHADIAEATRRLTVVLERWIRSEPAQWLWTHRKWDLPPEFAPSHDRYSG
jgi:KDO2-lipid IV(A) lauroyltransferase